MIFQKEIANRVARYLLQIEAIKLRPQKPFTWASGLRSPIYCDNRLALSYPDIRSFIRDALTKVILEYFSNTGIIAGVATAGIPQGVLVASELNLPFVYVRSSAKKHGMTNKIEGHFKPGDSAVVVEDLVSTGKSSLAAVNTLREAGVNVVGMVSIFTYDLPEAIENFKKENCQLISLSDYHHLINIAVQQQYIDKGLLDTLYTWREAPQEWSQIHK